jgi:vancomycin resistance protein VanJ
MISNRLRLEKLSVLPPMDLWRRRMVIAVTWCAWLYLAGVVVALVLMRVGGDRWWFPTMMVFGPRWLIALPLGLLLPLTVLTRRRLLLPVLTAAAMVFGPIMGGALPWGRFAAPTGPVIRVLTCNVKGHYDHNRSLEELIRTTAPDIIALQGCWGSVGIRWPQGWHVHQEGELLVASRFSLRRMSCAIPRFPPKYWPRAVLVSCTEADPQRDFCLCVLHLQSPHEGIAKMLDRHTVLKPSESSMLEEQIEDRWQETKEVTHWLGQCDKPLIVAGDFNMPPDSVIYRNFWSSYENAFTAAGLGFGYTEWPRLRRLPIGIRIDHVLTGRGWRPVRCWVGPDVGSDHLPLIADLVEER